MFTTKEFIKACKTEFQAELADYNGCYERGVLMTYLLFSRMAKFNLPFDQEPGSLLHQLTNGYNVLYPYAPISHMSSNTSSTSTLRSFGTFFGSHNIDSGALDPQASPKSLAKK